MTQMQTRRETKNKKDWVEMERKRREDEEKSMEETRQEEERGGGRGAPGVKIVILVHFLSSEHPSRTHFQEEEACSREKGNLLGSRRKKKCVSQKERQKTR